MSANSLRNILARGAVALALIVGWAAADEADAQGFRFQRRAPGMFDQGPGWRDPVRPRNPRPWRGGFIGFGGPRGPAPPYVGRPDVYDEDVEDAPPPRRARAPRRHRATAAPVRAQARPPHRLRAAPRRPSPPPASTRRANGAPAPGETRFAPREAIVEIAAGASEARLDRLARRLGLTRVETRRLALLDATIVRYRLPATRGLRASLAALQRDPAVAFAQPNYLYTLQQAPPAPPAGVAVAAAPAADVLPQYVGEALHLPAAHALAKGVKVRIAIIDSGVDRTHPELAGAVAASVDLVDGAAAPAETHGTAMAGAIAARARMQSVAPAAELLAARAFSGHPGEAGAQGATAQILRALDWAYEQKARIVNMSFAGPPDPLLRRMLAAAAKKDMILVAAAGNEGPRARPLYPAADPEVIAVTATDQNKRLFDKASGGGHVRLAAPGVGVLSVAPNGGYGFSTGTSIAAAHVSGIVALLLERNPRLSTPMIRKTLEATGAPPLAEGENDVRLADPAAALRSPLDAPTQ